MDTSEFREVFAAEARDYIQSLNENLLALETNPEDHELLDDMFRAAHSLKGMSGTMGFSALADFTHHMESVLDRLRNGELSVTTNVADILFRCVDTLEILLDQTLSEEKLVDTSQLIVSLSALEQSEASTPASSTELADEPTTGSEQVADDGTDSGLTSRKLVLDEFDKETVKQGREQGYEAYRVTVCLKPNTLLKSVRVYTVFQAVEGIGTVIKCYPSTQDLEDENFDLEFSVLLLTSDETDAVRQLIEGISEIQDVFVSELQDMDLTEREMEDRQANPASDVPMASPEAASSEETSDPTEGTAKEDTSATKQASTGGQKGRFADKFVRVETERLDKLINLVGELVINRTQVIEMGKSMDGGNEKTTISQLDRITTDLQYATMKLRMVPIKQVFDRFPRMVRDIAHSRDKDIHLELFGIETELDRSIVNQIGDPLVHLLRNSVDHGIESREQRIQAGKPEYGTLRLGARHEGSHILIELEDDGRGIDVDRVRQKAIERNLLPPDHSGKITVQEAVRLLFEPGFSTADSVSDISGRGVGMDAVKAVVESLSGAVEMQSTPGQGSRTTIKLPLTLAIIKALLVKSAGEAYAIPINAVRENLLISREQLKTVQQQEVIVLRNEVLPIIDLAECLGWERTHQDGDMSVIVVEVRGEKLGFIVEELIGQQEIVIKSLSDMLGDIPGIAGATVLGNGRVALILDNSTLIRQEA